MKASCIAYSVMPLIWFLVAIIVDISCYNILVNHYNIFGFTMDFLVSILVLAIFTFAPLGIMIMIFAEGEQDE